MTPQQETQDKIGSGIPGTITPAEIFDALGVYAVGFYFDPDTKKWTQSGSIPDAIRGTMAYPDVVVDLEYDISLGDDNDGYFSEDYTVTDHIRDKLNEYELTLERLLQ